MSVRVYTDEIKDANLIAEVDGVGYMPTPIPTPEKPGEATPEPTPQILFDVNAEGGDNGAITNRGNAKVGVIDGGANGTKKALEVSGRSADWQ